MQYIIFIIIIRKLNKKLRISINYKVFNPFIIKNCNILLLIKETLLRLYKIRFYNKFNSIAILQYLNLLKDTKETLRLRLLNS